jgi:hypothetical protein
MMSEICFPMNFCGIGGTFAEYKERLLNTRNIRGIQGTFAAYKEHLLNTRDVCGGAIPHCEASQFQEVDICLG